MFLKLITKLLWLSGYLIKKIIGLFFFFLVLSIKIVYKLLQLFPKLVFIKSLNHTKLTFGLFFFFLIFFFWIDIIVCLRLGLVSPGTKFLTASFSSSLFKGTRWASVWCDEFWAWLEIFVHPRRYKYAWSYLGRVHRNKWIRRMLTWRDFLIVLFNEWIYLKTESTQKFAIFCLAWKIPLRAILTEYVHGDLLFYDVYYYAKPFWEFYHKRPPYDGSLVIFGWRNLILEPLWPFAYSPLEPIFSYGMKTKNTANTLLVCLTDTWNKRLFSGVYEFMYYPTEINWTTSLVLGPYPSFGPYEFKYPYQFTYYLVEAIWDKQLVLGPYGPFGPFGPYEFTYYPFGTILSKWWFVSKLICLPLISLLFLWNIFILFLADYLANQRLVILVLYLFMVLGVMSVYL